MACDVTVRAQIEALLAATIERFGRVDVWVNNAGFGLMDSVERMDMAACRSMFDTNLFGAIECMQVVSPVLKQQRSGAIINISSMAGMISVPYMSAYGATKHALNCIGRAARMELAPYGVHVNTVCPGYVQTDFNMPCGAGRREPARGRQSQAWSYRRAGGRTRSGSAYRGNRREVVVPWSGNLVVGLYRLLPGVFNWGMLRDAAPDGSRGEELGFQLFEQRLHFALRMVIADAMRTGDAIAQPCMASSMRRRAAAPALP